MSELVTIDQIVFDFILGVNSNIAIGFCDFHNTTQYIRYLEEKYNFKKVPVLEKIMLGLLPISNRYYQNAITFKRSIFAKEDIILMKPIMDTDYLDYSQSNKEKSCFHVNIPNSHNKEMEKFNV